VLETCKCCGYVIEREELPIFSPIDNLSFLGSGFPLFYNFIIYCIMILFIFYFMSGGFNMATNYLGTFCMNPAIPESKKGEKPKKEESEEKCTYNVYHQFSLANKIDRPEFLEV